MNNKEFEELKEAFKNEVLDLHYGSSQFYEKILKGYLVSFEYDIWQSELSKVIFNDIEMLEVFDTLTDEEVTLTDLQLDELNQIAKLITSMDYEEYEHESEHAFNLGE